jgi:hypothetical protein
MILCLVSLEIPVRKYAFIIQDNIRFIFALNCRESYLYIRSKQEGIAGFSNQLSQFRVNVEVVLVLN